MRKVVVILIFILNAVFIRVGFSNNVTSIKDNKVALYGNKLELLQDQNNSILIDDAISAYRNNEFEPCDQLVYSASGTSSAYWFAITISNETPLDLWCSVSNAMLDTISFYKVNSANEVVLEKHCGTAFGREKSYENQFPFWFELLKAGENRHTFIFKTYSHLIMEFPFQIGSKEELYKNMQKRYIIISFFVGGMCLIFLYNFVLFFFIREKVYLYYCLYVFCATSVASLVNGFPFIEILFGLDFITNYGVLFFVGVIVFVILTTSTFLDIKASSRILYLALNMEMILVLTMCLLYLLTKVPLFFNIIQGLVLLSFITCFVSSISVSLKGGKSARIFLLGWTCMFIGAIIQLMVINGIVDANLTFRGIIIFPILIEVFIFSIALGYRIRKLKDELTSLNWNLSRTNEELKSSNDAIDSFNYHVSHELKTVMNNSRALSGMAVKYLEKENLPKVNEVLSKLAEVTTEGAHTVKTFLSLGTANSFLRSEKRTKINLKKSIDEIMRLSDLTEKIEIKFVRNSAGHLYLHQKAFDIFFLNFLTNTIKYNENKPVALICVKLKQNEQVITYEDNGIGIDMKAHGNQVFQPFVRIKNDLKKEGSGVGLYLVKQIVQNYKGTINVYSEPGKGVQFVIRIPIEANDSPES